MMKIAYTKQKKTGRKKENRKLEVERTIFYLSQQQVAVEKR